MELRNQGAERVLEEQAECRPLFVFDIVLVECEDGAPVLQVRKGRDRFPFGLTSSTVTLGIIVLLIQRVGRARDCVITVVMHRGVAQLPYLASDRTHFLT
ncbi:hypothetical protein [Rhizobium leguminosarum]